MEFLEETPLWNLIPSRQDGVATTAPKPLLKVEPGEQRFLLASFIY